MAIATETTHISQVLECQSDIFLGKYFITNTDHSGISEDENMSVLKDY